MVYSYTVQYSTMYTYITSVHLGGGGRGEVSIWSIVIQYSTMYTYITSVHLGGGGERLVHGP